MAGSATPSDEDLVFDHNDSGDDGGAPAGGNEPFGQPISETPDNAQVSDAIRNLIRGPQAAPQPAPAPAKPTPAPAVAAKEGEAPFSPREQALLNELKEERRLRQSAQNPQGQGQPQQRPDVASQLFENPEAFVAQITGDFSRQLATVRLEGDLNIAAMRHGDTFNEAFQAFMGQVGNGTDRDTYFRIMNAPSPGEEIVKWFKQSSVLREVGEDPAAYRERLRAEMLEDPEALAAFAAKLGVSVPQAAAQVQAAPAQPRADDGKFVPGKPRLPTSIGRIPGGSTAASLGDEDGSDDAIFDAGRSKK